GCASACAGSTRCAPRPVPSPRRSRPGPPGRPRVRWAGLAGGSAAGGERARGLIIESQALAGELRDYVERAAGLALDDASSQLAGAEISLDGIEERLAAIERLARKHGGSIRAVLDFAEGARARRDELTGVEVALEQAEESLREARSALDGHVATLRRERRRAAKEFALAVRAQLASLAMGDASFEVGF